MSEQVTISPRPAPLTRSLSSKSKRKIKKRLSGRAISQAFSKTPLASPEIITSPRFEESGPSIHIKKLNEKLTPFYFTSNSLTPRKAKALQTKLRTVVVLGPAGSGKSEFIQKVMKLDSVAIPKENILDTESQLGKISDESGEDVLFTMVEARDTSELSLLPDGSNLSIIVLCDHTQANSTELTDKLLQKVRKFKKGRCIETLLVLTKIDRLGSSKNQMEDIFHSVIHMSYKYNCKLLPVTITMNKTHIFTCLRTVALPNESQSLQSLCTLSSINESFSKNNYSYIFHDNSPSVAEDFFWVQKNRGEWKETYCCVKAEFIILQEETDVIVLFLTLCTTKAIEIAENITDISKGFSIKTPGGNEYIFSSHSEDQVNEWVNICSTALTAENILHFSGNLEAPSPGNPVKQHRNGQPKISFSAILNIANRIGCADCGTRCGTPIISRQYCIYLCSSCASAHSLVLGKSSKILSTQEIKKFSTIWPALHEKCNFQFNLLWENSKPPQIKLNSSSTPEERVAYIRSKYKIREYYSCYKFPLFTASSNSIEWHRKYLYVSCHGELTISDDEERALNEITSHISYCTFVPGSEIGLSPEHFSIVMPNATIVFRSDNEEISMKWLSVLYSSAQRVKYTELSFMNPLMSLPRIRKRKSGTLKYSMADLNTLLIEKQRLNQILKSREKEEQMKEHLEELLHKTLSEIQSLKILEAESLEKIASLEPSFIRSDISSLTMLYSESLRRDTRIKPESAYLPNRKALQKSSSKRRNILRNIEEGILIFNEGESIAKGGSANRIIELLVSPLYHESEYESIILYTFPSFMHPFKFLDTLEHAFVLPIREASNSSNAILEKLGNKPMVKGVEMNKCNFQTITRNNVLCVIERWIDEFWNSDFNNSQLLIAKVIAFLDYIVQQIVVHKEKATFIRNKLVRNFEKSLTSTSYSTIIQGTIGKLSALPRGGISSLADCIEVLTDVDISIVAKQICLIDQKLLGKIHVRELLDKSWMTPDRDELSPNVVKVTEQFNKLSDWVGTCILQASKKKQRVKILEWFIVLAQRCEELHNFNALIAILGGLQDPSIIRLKATWESINARTRAIFDEIKLFLDVDNNWSNYRKQLNITLKANLPCVPYIGLYLKDLIVIEDAFPDILEMPDSPLCTYEVINIEKRRKFFHVTSDLKIFQKIEYPFQRDGVVMSSLELGLSTFPLLDAAQRFELSKVIEPRPVSSVHGSKKPPGF